MGLYSDGKEAPKQLPRRAPATVTVKFRGGASCFWEFSWAGRSIRVDGGMNLHDAMRKLFEDQWHDGSNDPRD